MSTRVALCLTLTALLTLVLGAPQAMAYGGVRAWGPWLCGGAAGLALAVTVALARRPDRPRVPLYAALAVTLLGVLLTARLMVERMA